MRTIWIVLVILILASCNKNKKLNPRSFNSIDYSFYSGAVSCLKFNKDGKGNFYHCDLSERKYYIDMTLKSDQIDSISNMVFKLINSKIDTLYVCGSEAYSADFTVIKTDNKTYRYFVSGACWRIPEIKCLYDLTGYLYDLTEKSKESIKDKFYFESYSIFFFPPQLPVSPDGSLPEETRYEKMKP